MTRCREANPNAMIVAETVSDDNRQRLMNAGANALFVMVREGNTQDAHTVQALVAEPHSP